ncbi:hypothetical protein M758_1G199600 [Ceratodon purpureus]|nr:hypothetical protein M758_1G199600 [Ceratodon purpureus]
MDLWRGTSERAMAFKLGSLNLNAVAQGVGGLVFGTSNYGRDEDDGGVEDLLERISNGKLADDRRSAMQELEAAVAENRAAKLAFGAMGFPILMAVFREERQDLEMVRGALETILHALTTEDPGQEESGQVQAGKVNSELLAREPASIALLLGLLDEPDFYVRYHTLQLLTALLTNCPTRLQDMILSIPQGITRLMDMLAEREVIRNEALIVLAYLTRSAEEIQKIVVFEGAFDRLFNIIREEGGCEGGIIVQDCLELLNNLLRSNPSNQIFLRETLGLQYICQLLKLRKGSADSITQQKSINLLCVLETVALLLAGGPDAKPGKDANIVANQTLFSQNKLLDILLALSVEGLVSAVAIRCSALRCIGDLVVGHPANRDILGSKTIGEEPDTEPALNCVLKALLNATNLSECIAAEYVVKCYCEGNPDGQTMLASTLNPIPQSIAQGDDRLLEDGSHPSFGSMLVGALISSDGRNDLEASCRAASVLSHILKDNVQCKERVLKIPLEIPSFSTSSPELLMARCMKYLAAASPAAASNQDSPGTVWLQPVFLRLLVTWVVECPPAVTALLFEPAHLPVLIELLGSTGSTASVHVAGLAAVLLGACIIFNSEENSKDSSAIVDLISQRVGLASFFTKWEDMENSSLFASALSSSRLPEALTRSTAAAAAIGDGMVSVPFDQQQQVRMFGGSSNEPLVTTFYDAEFVAFLQQLGPLIKERVVDLFSRPKTRVVVDFKGFEQKKGESDTEYMHRLKLLLQTQALEVQELLEKNSAITSDLLLNSKAEGFQLGDEKSLASTLRERHGAVNRAEVEALKQQLEVTKQWAEAVLEEKNDVEKEYLQYKEIVAERENDFKGLSDAYNALEQENSRLEDENKTLRSALQAGGVVPVSASHEELEAAREEGRKEAQKESEGELNDLLVCLGQEETKVERLSVRLRELGEDVDTLLDGIGDPEGDAGGDDDDDEDDDN